MGARKDDGARPAPDVLTGQDGSAPARAGGGVTPRAAFWGRLLLAHVLAYPLAFVTATAVTSLAVVGYGSRLDEVAPDPHGRIESWLVRTVALRPEDAARVTLMLRPIAGASLGVALGAHLGAIPWARAAGRAARARGSEERARRERDVRRAHRIWLSTLVGLTALALVAGGLGWIWIFTR